ncbi:hypothetical protein HanIR_Chr13g0660871 [Helianthus annuus]|nr:hypothetical protein HanIR_Chr13g0660871 [Helianthus annuus]
MGFTQVFILEGLNMEEMQDNFIKTNKSTPHQCVGVCRPEQEKEKEEGKPFLHKSRNLKGKS